MADSTFAEHVATTNNRLASLRANLIDASTFSEACSELTKWCQDQRAFTAHFEDNLMLALEVAMDYGTRENYDYMLTHGLVGACFTHRKHLSKQSGTRISRWYEQMRRLKKNGGKRKRAPPKPKEPPVSSLNGSVPGLTSPCTIPPPPSSGALALPSNGQQPTENNNFVFSPTSNSDGSMWAPQGVPMSQPGSSAGHMPPGASGGAAPYPGQMNPPTQHPGMGGGYPGGQMQLPYAQMEGNHAMYDHRMMAANRAAAAAAAAAGRPQGMMPDYPQMPMGQNPQGGMMRMPVQYPPGHPQMQYGQMMRAPPVSVYGQMNHAQQYAVTAHPNPSQTHVILPEVRALYETTAGYHIERELVSEGMIAIGTFGCDATITPDAYGFLEQNPNADVILSVWQSVKGNESDCRFEVFVNSQLIMNHLSENKSVSIKQYVRSGNNVINFGYSGPMQMHSFACEFVTRRNIGDLRRLVLMKRSQDAQNLMNQQRMTFMQMANKRQAGTVVSSLNCAISKKRMYTPARHNECKKFVFDLAQLINASKLKTRYHCNYCNVHFKFEDINIDYFLMNAACTYGPGVHEVVVDKTGQVRPGEHEDLKPKRGKKKIDNGDLNGGHTIKRIKSEIIVKQEPGVYPDIHGRNVPFSPMPMPGSAPPDWTRLQSPSFSMQSPNKIQLGPATPATPGMIFQNPASAGSMLNMSSPRQTMMPHGHPMMPPHDPSLAVRSGSAPYTPESVKNDKNDELLMYIEGLFITSSNNLIEAPIIYKYMDGTKDDSFEDYLVYEMPSSPKQQQQLEGTQTLMAPGSTSSSNASTFTPPFDDIHLGNRPSH